MNKFKTYQLSLDFYYEVEKLNAPPFLQDQLLRAASSITLNLAEGSGKRTSKDQRKFFYQAFGSYKECKAVMDLTKYKSETINKKMEILGAHLWKLIQFHNQRAED